MRKFWPGLLLLISTTAGAQTRSRYQQELLSLDSLLRKTSSFKKQIKGDKKIVYQSRLDSLSNRSDTSTSFERFQHLCHLLESIKDNHQALHLAYHDQVYPRSNWNLDSLQSVLSNKSPDEPEGIYHYGNFYTVGLAKTAPGEYTGVVLQSFSSKFNPGDIVILLKEKDTNTFTGIYCHPHYKVFSYYPVEKFGRQKLLYSFFYNTGYNGVYTKPVLQRNGSNGSSTTSQVQFPIDYADVPDTTANFTVYNVSPQADYIRIRSFANFGPQRKQSDSLFQILQNRKTSPYTIIDLRNNQGGSSIPARKYERWIKSLTGKSKVIVLVNAGTVSQGEITALQLAKNKSILLAGETTKGMIAYGSNYGNTIKLAGEEMVFYPTDMVNRNMLPYEDKGIQPHIQLKTDEDWITQILRYWKLLPG
jgi:hypothetical protein